MIKAQILKISMGEDSPNQKPFKIPSFFEMTGKFISKYGDFLSADSEHAALLRQITRHNQKLAMTPHVGKKQEIKSQIISTKNRLMASMDLKFSPYFGVSL